MLKVVKLNPNAQLPTVGHPGEDLGFDVFALEDTVLPLGVAVAVSTGISARYELEQDRKSKFGLLIKDRSSMAAKGIRTSAGVVDAGYTGELKVMMTNTNPKLERHDFHEGYFQAYQIKAGDKIAQMIPTEVFTAGNIIEVGDLGQTSRGLGGFGSTGV